MLHLPTRSLGNLGWQRRVGPERLAQPEHVGVDARALAVRNPAAVAGQVRGLVQQVQRRGVQGPVGNAARDQDLLAAQQFAEHAVFQRLPIAGEHHVREHRGDAGVVPEEVVALAGNPGVLVQGLEGQLAAPHALGPNRVGVVLVEVPAEAIQRNRRPLPVPGTDAAGRLGETVNALALAMVQLPGKGVGDLQPLLRR